MPRLKSAGAGDAVGLERADGILESRDAGQMRAVGAAARDDAGMPVDDQGRAEILHGRRDRLDAIGQRAFVVMRQAQQHGGDIGAIERRQQIELERADIGRGRRHEIETRLRTVRPCAFETDVEAKP